MTEYRGTEGTRPYAGAGWYYAEYRQRVSTEFILLLAARLGWTRAERVLDLGAGPGQLALLVAPLVADVFLGAAITATSVGITARVLRDVQAARSGEARVILGAAVVDDVLALVVLGAVSVWAAAPAASGSQSSTVIALVLKTIGFLVLTVIRGVRYTPAWFRGA